MNSAANPAAVGSIVSVFATGLGPITPAQADGSHPLLPLPVNVLPVQVGALGSVAGQPFGSGYVPLEVTYAGPEPFLVAGESQINFRISAIPLNLVATQLFVTLPATRSQGFQVWVGIP